MPCYSLATQCCQSHCPCISQGLALGALNHQLSHSAIHLSWLAQNQKKIDAAMVTSCTTQDVEQQKVSHFVFANSNPFSSAFQLFLSGNEPGISSL